MATNDDNEDSASSASGTWAATWRPVSSPPDTRSTARSATARTRRGLVHEGLQWRDTPREVAEAADVVFTSVPDDGVLERVASGPTGSSPASPPGRSGST